MASILTGTVPWHDGEQKIQNLMRVPLDDNPTVPYLSPGAAFLVQRAPLFALGTLDEYGRPWSTVWGGESGFAGPTSESNIEVKSLVDRQSDPVLDALLNSSANGKDESKGDAGKTVSALSIDLGTRKRAKLSGRMVSASLGQDSSADGTIDSDQKGKVQLTVKIETSLATPKPKLVSNSPQLPSAAIDLVNRADTMFLSTAGMGDMDTNIRGGPPGFIRVSSNEQSGAVLVYPEYSGNRLYQTLGNMQINPVAGYVFPDFETGNALYATGTTEILIGKDASKILPRSNLAVRVTLTSARFVETALPFRGTPGQLSPYTPSIRYLATEKNNPAAQDMNDPNLTATLIKKEELTPTITRFRFRISDPTKTGRWIPGQYATFSFQDELDMGYSHMRDDDPPSLNDDYVRTFTISSHPDSDIASDEFEITVRKHGNVTRYLSQTSERAGLEVPLRGFGGSFRFEDGEERVLPFVAGGIGITPLIAQLPGIDISRLRLFWSISGRDLGLVLNTFERFPDLPGSTRLFVTGLDLGDDAEVLRQFKDTKASGARVEGRRMEAGDLDLSLADVWYLCAETGLKRMVLNWLSGKRVVYEDFCY
ncbi:Oxidoreductase [Aspergillus sclerotialis]|uniref:Oxidoreductase n=1 Tax=Aspergillus sclerotialis TaxID=2070753 RepID=A0A3A2ZPM0_9EURO|nr:Oxidoreductase [Aspergillus sclerotialis]